MRGVAGAPVSFGVFELTTDRPLPSPDEVLAAVRDADYDGIDLGPVGWLGRGTELRERLRRHRLSLSGGWVELPFSDDAAFGSALATLDEVVGIFVDAAQIDPARPPLPTLADAGSAERRAHPGGTVPGIALDEARWIRFAANVGAAADRVRAAGLEPTFHHHAGTYVETPAEIDRFVERTDVGLTLDTGHLLLGGGDPVEGLARWGNRINHVHVKDTRIAVLEQIVRDGADVRAVWDRRAFVPLGEGDLDLDGFMAALVDSGYDAWLVVEQDVIPGPGDPPDLVVDDQRANREALRKWLP